MSGGNPRPLAGDAGAVTVEAAIALAALVCAVTLCIGALLAASTQVRCVDAAREAARLAARGDTAHALTAARTVAPPGATIDLRTEADHIVATVSATTPLLPGLRLHAQAVAIPEPGVR
ncbi:TadE family type IV pilus minor pilin [Nocardia sp. AG03]|uniref:TadE family type IV pilus minor pilin n=1 Tax=Nocardia sp. AG03 TaxID=3025312 RepID=UPI00241868F9|nr:TadE family type IV pilus minor pilin [Nocardia sp. AG03]